MFALITDSINDAQKLTWLKSARRSWLFLLSFIFCLLLDFNDNRNATFMFALITDSKNDAEKLTWLNSAPRNSSFLLS
ncbi:hypothetical protein ABTG62_18845, partial [Acinetobacter baumannii]